MRYLLYSLIILFFSNINAQSFDSIIYVAKALRHDSDRITLLYKQGFEKRTINPQYSYECAKKAEAYAQKLSLPFYSAKVNNLLGVLYYRKGELKKAITYHLNALNIRSTINDKRGMALSQINLGNAYSDLNNYSLAESYYLKALQINTELNNEDQINNCLINLGTLAAQQKKDEIALEYFSTVLNKAKKNNNYELQALAFNNLAVIKMNSKEFEESIGMSYNSIKAKDLSENEIEKADSYLNIALCYLFLNDLKQTKTFLQISDSIINRFDYLAAKLNYLQLEHQYYNAISDHKSAYNSLCLLNSLNDSITLANKEAKLENDFTEMIEEAKNASTANNSSTGIYWFWGILILLGIVLFMFVLKNKR